MRGLAQIRHICRTDNPKRLAVAGADILPLHPCIRRSLPGRRSLRTLPDTMPPF